MDTQVDFALAEEYDTVAFSAEGLPEGLSLAEDGTLYGTPASEAGGVSYGPIVGVSALVGLVCAGLGTVGAQALLRRKETDKVGEA